MSALNADSSSRFVAAYGAETDLQRALDPGRASPQGVRMGDSSSNGAVPQLSRRDMRISPSQSRSRHAHPGDAQPAHMCGAI